MKTKEERAKNIADRFFTAYPDSINVDEIYSTEHNKRLYNLILQELSELPDFNPYKIDWERLRDCFLTASDGYISSHLHVAVKIYNSTLPEGLKPLPKEMPEWFHGGHNFYKLWSLVCHNYGTASNLQPLPSVDELHTEINQIWNSQGANLLTVTKHIHSKYGTQPREWWRELKPLVKFVCKDEKGDPKTLSYVKIVLKDVTGKEYDIWNCTPYTAPTADEIIAKYNLSEEEVKIIKQS